MVAVVDPVLDDRRRSKLIAAGGPYRAVARVFRVSTAAVHQRLKKMPEAAHHDLERADLGRLLEVRS